MYLLNFVKLPSLAEDIVHEVFMKLEAARAKLTDSREKPNGELKVTTTPGIGVHWLTPRLGEFIDSDQPAMD